MEKCPPWVYSADNLSIFALHEFLKYKKLSYKIVQDINSTNAYFKFNLALEKQKHFTLPHYLDEKWKKESGPATNQIENAKSESIEVGKELCSLISFHLFTIRQVGKHFSMLY